MSVVDPQEKRLAEAVAILVEAVHHAVPARFHRRYRGAADGHRAGLPPGAGVGRNRTA